MLKTIQEYCKRTMYLVDTTRIVGTYQLIYGLQVTIQYRTCSGER